MRHTKRAYYKDSPEAMLRRRRLAADAAERLGLGRGMGGRDPWIKKLSSEERCAELAKQREIEAGREAPVVTFNPTRPPLDPIIKQRREERRLERERLGSVRRVAHTAGDVYALINRKLLPGWRKVGYSFDPNSRASAGNVFDPYNGWEVEGRWPFDNAAAAEELVHQMLEEELPIERIGKGEFYLTSLDHITDAATRVSQSIHLGNQYQEAA